jgi:hypothetical protein
MSKRIYTKDTPTDPSDVMSMLENPWWRLRNLYHIKSEDTGQIIPFRPYPEQEEVFKGIVDDGFKRIIIPKARRRGMSTGIDILMQDYALTNAGFEGGIVDRNQAEASKKLANIIKISVEKLPEFLRENIILKKSNDDHLSFSVGKDIDSHIYASTGYRGGNCNFLHVSEWGWIQCADPKRSEEIQTGAIQAARKGITVVETTWKGGKRGHLWEYTKSALETPDNEKHERSWRVMFFPWHTDPVYSSPTGSPIRREVMDYFMELAGVHNIICTEAQMRWYQEEAFPLGNNRFGEYPSTLEECFKSPMEGVIYEAEMSRALAERRVTSIPIEAGLPVFVSMDIGRNDAMPLVFIQPVGKELRVVGYYVNHREAVAHYGNYIKTWMAAKRVQDVRIILPHDGGRKSMESGRTLVDVLREMGFANVQTIPKISSVWAGINYVRDTFPYLYFDRLAISEKFSRGSKEFPSLLECIENYHQAETAGGMMTSLEPVHDDYSHGCDALRTFAEGWQRGMISRTVGRTTASFGGNYADEDEEPTKSRLAGGLKWRK